MNPLSLHTCTRKTRFFTNYFAAFICHFVPFFFVGAPLIYSVASLKGSPLQMSVSIILAFTGFFVRAHCVRFLAWCVYLCSLPPTLLLSLSLSLSQHLTSIITALDSSNDGKCFSIPCSPSTPPESPSFPFSLQANYISVTIETCLLNAFCFTLSLTHSSAFPPPCLLSSRMRLN